MNISLELIRKIYIEIRTNIYYYYLIEYDSVEFELKKMN